MEQRRERTYDVDFGAGVKVCQGRLLFVSYTIHATRPSHYL